MSGANAHMGRHRRSDVSVRDYAAAQIPMGVGVGAIIAIIIGFTTNSWALGIGVGLVIACVWAVAAAGLAHDASHRRHRRRFTDRV